jgi:Ankyrin repeats (many copies)
MAFVRWLEIWRQMDSNRFLSDRDKAVAPRRHTRHWVAILLFAGVVLLCFSGVVALRSSVRQSFLDEELIGVAELGQDWKIPGLIEQGANPNCRFEGNITPIMLAAVNGHDETVRKLIAYGADPLLKDDWGQDALNQTQGRTMPALDEWRRERARIRRD